MTLEFAPLAWIYHDGWSFSQSTTVLEPDDSKTTGTDGVQPMKATTKSTTCHQRGHVHLFLPTVPFNPDGSSLAYSGEQTYRFSVVDEWGPNSDDTNQNRSVKLIGKPVWYVYVEEYWRRFYAQPWDIVDESCDLPLNQEVTYTSRGIEDYSHEVLSNGERTDSQGNKYKWDWHKSDISINGTRRNSLSPHECDGRNDDGSVIYGIDPTSNEIGYDDYLTIMRRRRARLLFLQQDGTRSLFIQWLVSLFFQNGEAYVASDGSLVANSYNTVRQIISDSRIAGYALSTVISLDPNATSKVVTVANSIPDAVAIAFIYGTDSEGHALGSNLIGEFDQFYRLNASRYGGYADTLAIVQSFMSLHSLKFKDGCKIGDGNTILVPDDQTVGHVGIRFDASKPCHSLGPFREGGEFYFFNTVVNRTMPCEYWLDDERKTRQYFIKSPREGYEQTTGGQTWTFAGDRTHFVWVYDAFGESSAIYEDYEVDSKKNDRWYNGTHRMPDINSSNGSDPYYFNGMNAKRLKDDRSLNVDGLGMVSVNDTVLHDDYQQDAQTKTEKVDSTSPRAVIYTDDDVIVDTSTESTTTREIPQLHWESDGWTGWYEYNELAKCARDMKWYRRTWKPIGYVVGARYSGDQPFWTAQKRMAFPNPSPWLCDSPDGSTRYSTSPVSEGNPSMLPAYPSSSSHWCTSTPYADDESNRIHLLHWEYALYFNLVRVRPRNAPQDESTLRRRIFVYDGIGPVAVTVSDGSYATPSYDPSLLQTEAPADIETLFEEYADQHGYPEDIETESSIFDDWLSTLGHAYFSVCEDRDVLLHHEGNTTVEITDDMIREGGMYQYGTQLLPLPPPVLTVSYATCGVESIGSQPPVTTQTYLSFPEFATVWTPLTDEERQRLRLDGDMPRRNQTPYPYDPIESYPELQKNDATGDYASYEYPSTPGDTTEYAPIADEREFKEKTTASILPNVDGEASPSLLQSDFFPRSDAPVRHENDRRDRQKPKEPPLHVSPLDEIDQFNAVMDSGAPFDPYRNGKVDPLATWRKYFTHMEIFTIPDHTTVGGGEFPPPSPQEEDKGESTDPLDTPEPQQQQQTTQTALPPSSVGPHPRETSYHHEDGARRHYPDDFFVSPVIEYQKIIRSDYGRLPGKEAEEARFKETWRSGDGDWGDGFEITVSIPWKIEDEVQSPFSDSDNVTTPVGTYCHNAVKPEDMMRHHLEFYDSLDQIRKYDFPHYIDLVHDFQKRCMPEGYATPAPSPSDSVSYATDPDSPGTYIATETVEAEDGTTKTVSYPVDATDFTQSLYKEDFNDPEKTRKLRDDPKDAGLATYNQTRTQLHLKTYRTWQDALDDYWSELNSLDDPTSPDYRKYINAPVARCTDCTGQPTVENAFTRTADGKMVWREQTTHLFPTIDKVPRLDDGTVGYIGSDGSPVRGGGAVKFNDPYPDHHDGKWYEQCLGAQVRAKCLLILEDALGFRWKQWVDATALQPDQPIRGNDYDG